MCPKNNKKSWYKLFKKRGQRADDKSAHKINKNTDVFRSS